MKERAVFRCLVVFAAAVLATTGAFATTGTTGTPGAYVGASAGQSNTSVDGAPGASFDGSGTAFKLQGGYRVMRYFGVEADYRDFGSQDDNVGGQETEIDTTSLDLFAMGVVPVGRSFEVFAKAGWSNWNADVTVQGVGSGSNDGTDLAYGLGGSYAVGKFDLRLEFEQFDIADADNVTCASVGFNYKF
jgi:outer membrane protein with beta-barrel domain